MGVVHRDVKPSNILVVGERALLTDFGLAKRVSGRTGTQSELLGGTLEYAAPEQLEGKPVDARTDVYSLGSSMLFVLTGRAPGIGHLWGENELPSLPPALEAVLARARARDPSERYASTGELARAALAAAKGGGMVVPARGPAQPAGQTRLRARPVPLPPPPPEPEPEPAGVWQRWRLPILALSGGILLGLAGVAGALVTRDEPPKPTPTPAPSPTPTVVITPTPSPTPTEAPTETPTPEPTPTEDPVSDEQRRVERAVARHWRAIENGNYEAAYDRFAPELQQDNGRARWIAAQRRDGREAVELEVEPEVTSDTRATARVVFLRTRAEGSGCNNWSGTYVLRKIDGAWRISEADLERREC
jgi:serine/threonine-protein kinase